MSRERNLFIKSGRRKSAWTEETQSIVSSSLENCKELYLARLLGGASIDPIGTHVSTDAIFHTLFLCFALLLSDETRKLSFACSLLLPLFAIKPLSCAITGVDGVFFEGPTIREKGPAPTGSTPRMERMARLEAFFE